MKAKEARKISEDNRKELFDIYQKIEAESHEGNCDAYIYMPKLSALKTLRKRGFRVEKTRIEDGYNITWRKRKLKDFMDVIVSAIVCIFIILL